MNPADESMLLSMLQLDSAAKIDKQTQIAEIDKRRARSSDDHTNQSEHMTLLYHYVKAVERGYYPEQDVIESVAVRFREVLEQTTYLLDQLPAGDYWTETPHTSARETGSAFVNAFGAKPNNKDPSGFDEVLEVREKLARIAVQKPSLSIESAFTELLEIERVKRIKRNTRLRFRASERRYERAIHSSTEQTAGQPLSLSDCHALTLDRNPEITADLAQQRYEQHRARVRQHKEALGTSDYEAIWLAASWALPKMRMRLKEVVTSLGELSPNPLPQELRDMIADG